MEKEIYISNGNEESTIISFDKGIYKPGDTVNYRALLINRDNDEPVESTDVNVCIYDGNDNKVYNENIKSSDFGILSGNFSLADEVNSGIYKLTVKTENNETSKQFKVNPYVTPKYEVKINYDKENYLVEDNANIEIEAKYFYGESVKNAEVKVYIDNNEYKTLTTDANGKAVIEYPIKSAKTYNIKVEAVDSSNYFVEEESSFTASTGAFEVQLLSEYGSLVAGRKNEIYIFTNKSDGTPVKAYVTVSATNYTKQVLTDENGIGKFSIDIDSISTTKQNANTVDSVYTTKQNAYTVNSAYASNKSNSKSFSIVAEDTKGNKVSKQIEMDIEQKNLLLSTDKVKYNEGEDIKLEITSNTENKKNIYIFKNDKLIKMLSTDLDETAINLDETYGLIDIYITDKTNLYTSSNFKKTIFINPSKKLNINITADKDEYKPKDDINITFNTVDESNNGIETALLVSMLDNSVLNLANNDLSIDNIKIALQDIEFSNELDAATLYSCIVNDKSESTMMALLLKQTNKNINVSETSLTNSTQEEKAMNRFIISIIIFMLIMLILLKKKTKKFNEIIKFAINYIIFEGIIILTIWEERFEDNFWWIFAIATIFGLAFFISILVKKNKEIFKTSKSIIISCLIVILLILIINVIKIPIKAILLVVSIILLVLAILSRCNKLKKVKPYFEKIKNKIFYILKFIISALISIIIWTFICKKYYFEENIYIALELISIYMLNYLLNIKIKRKTKKSIASKIVLIILSILGIIGLSYGLINILSDYDEPIVLYSSGLSSGYLVDSQMSASISPSKEISNILDSAKDSLNISNSAKDYSKVQESIKTENITDASKIDETIQTTTDENIRNVFLESMCFIPELVTTNGNANLNLKLSDNITSWTIQAVGNTKNGRIGYGILENVKVLKEFFVDFELPKNLIETDKISIPVTVYNYTDNKITTTLKIEENDWFLLTNNNINITINANDSKMVYVPITILKNGTYKFRTEVSYGSLTDIVEKECTINPEGQKIEKVVSTGSLNEDISEDILLLDDIVENTGKVKVKIYASTISQAIEGMEKIFKMPTGCFEQVSSSLYPNILALKYLESSGIVNEEISNKAKSYISSGYQKLLSYEVKGESGGYSLYGGSPAETVLTAYGLMEISDLSEVYKVDETVINKMTDFLYNKQNSNGSFQITGNHIGGAGSRENLALNAYITWALSESNPKDNRLNKSIEYLKDKLDNIDDNYTLALVANALANMEDKDLKDILKRLINNVVINENVAYLTSNVSDYYGTRGNVQNIQTVALTSMALSKASYKDDINKLLINYLLSKKDSNGTWYSTQATILSLKALNEKKDKEKLENQTISVKLNTVEQKIEIKDNALEFYELTFDNVSKENKLNIDIKKGDVYYEVIEEYYIPYEKAKEGSNNNIDISVECNNTLKVNEILKANIKAINKSENDISNGMITISIPQGFAVVEDSLMLLEANGIIEKYDMSYTEVNIYLRDFERNQVKNLEVKFRASYPVEITGLSVRAYDYYNPSVEGLYTPIEIKVK